MWNEKKFKWINDSKKERLQSKWERECVKYKYISIYEKFHNETKRNESYRNENGEQDKKKKEDTKNQM